MGCDIGKSSSEICAQVDGQRADEIDFAVVPLVDLVRKEVHRHRLSTGEKEQLAGVRSVVEIKAEAGCYARGSGLRLLAGDDKLVASRLLAVTPSFIPPRASNSCAARCSCSSRRTIDHHERAPDAVRRCVLWERRECLVPPLPQMLLEGDEATVLEVFVPVALA